MADDLLKRQSIDIVACVRAYSSIPSRRLAMNLLDVLLDSTPAHAISALGQVTWWTFLRKRGNTLRGVRRADEVLKCTALRGKRFRFGLIWPRPKQSCQCAD